MSRRRSCGLVLLVLLLTMAAAAPILTPHAPTQQFVDMANAPPMLPTLATAVGRGPAVHPLVLEDRLERRYGARPAVPLRWFHDGVLLSIDERDGPWLPLGGDPLGRDVWARLLYGARLSLGVALAASVLALVLGVLVGAPAGFLGGRVEGALMAFTDFVLVLPSLYVALALRSALPLVLSGAEVFAALVLVLAVVGWPIFARGVRAIVAAERHKEYAEAAYAAGASPLRILQRHLLPATAGFLKTTSLVIAPAFLLAEGTLSLVGLGFPVPTASWGAMLADAWHGAAFTDAPWLLAPAGALVLTMLSLYLIAQPENGTLPPV